MASLYSANVVKLVNYFCLGILVAKALLSCPPHPLFLKVDYTLTHRRRSAVRAVCPNGIVSSSGGRGKNQ